MALNFNKAPAAPASVAGAEYDKHLGEAKASTTVDTAHKGQQQTSATNNETVKTGETGTVNAANLLRLRVEGGQTFNLGDYNSAKVGVSIEVPTTFKALEKAYEFASNWVSGKIEEVAKSITGGQG